MSEPYYDRDGIKLFCGDNVEVMRSLPAASVDMVCTSPPYDDLRSYSAGKPMSELWNFEAVAQELWRLIKPGGVVVWVVADATVNGSETGTSFRQALRFMEIGFKLWDTMIYQKHGFSFPESIRYHQIWEYMFVLAKGGAKTFHPICDRENKTAGQNLGGDYKRDSNGTSVCRPGSKQRGNRREYGQRFNIWQIAAGCGQSSDDKSAFEHPAIFPEDLARDHILSWSNEGDTILDPFSGSCTTLKMARATGRKSIGIEINEQYCEIGVKRLAQRLLDFSS